MNRHLESQITCFMAMRCRIAITESLHFRVENLAIAGSRAISALTGRILNLNLRYPELPEVSQT